MTQTLAGLAGTIKDIDFTMPSTRASYGGIRARPMSNNRDVENDGDSGYFANTRQRSAKSSATRR